MMVVLLLAHTVEAEVAGVMAGGAVTFTVMGVRVVGSQPVV